MKSFTKALNFIYAQSGISRPKELKTGGNGSISLSRNEEAIMALLSFPLIFRKATAFILNIVVSGFSFWFSKKKNHFEWKLFYPFALASVPAVFIGGFIRNNEHLNNEENR